MTNPPPSKSEFLSVAEATLSGVLSEEIIDLKGTDHLLDDIGLDSFGVFVFVGELEVRLNVVFPPTDAEPTLNNLYRLAVGAPR